MLAVLHREAVYFWYYFDIQFRQIFKYWVLGIIIGSVIAVFAKDKIHGLFERMNGKKMGIFGLIPASLLGIASPLCMYGTIPIAASFANKGMRQDWLAAFMMSSILLNPQLIVYSTALGGVALIVRFVSCILCGIAAGLLVHIFYRNKQFFSFGKFREPVSHDTDPNMFFRHYFRDMYQLINLWLCSEIMKDLECLWLRQSEFRFMPAVVERYLYYRNGLQME